ncbi:MAG: trehalose-phosphatase [Acidobacteriota bacterium]
MRDERSAGTTAVLLATDFDGTIAPIVTIPEEACIHPLAARLLEHCSALPEIAVAVISGRDVDDVRRRIGGVRAIVAGSHGLECVAPDGTVLWTEERRCPELPPSLTRDALHADLRIERKKYSFALHSRDVAGDPQQMKRVIAAVTSWADEHNLDVIGGREVTEVRVRGGGKRAALRTIAARYEPRGMVYAGDDITDFPALAFAATHGRAIFVESEERTPPEIPGLWRVARIEDLCFAFVRALLEHVPGLAFDAGPHSVTESVSSATESSPERNTAR